MKTKLLAGLIAGCSMFFVATISQATTLTTFTDYDTWAVNVDTYQLEDFDDSTLVSGLGFTSTSGGRVNSGGYFYDRPTASNGGTVWTFDTAVNSFGGIWDLAGPGGSGMGLLLTMSDGSSTFVAPEISNATDNFWGFTADTYFTSVSIVAATQGGIAETYHLDNLVFGNTPATAAVPEPATMLLFGTGLIGLIGSRSRTKRRNG